MRKAALRIAEMRAQAFLLFSVCFDGFSKALHTLHKGFLFYACGKCQAYLLVHCRCLVLFCDLSEAARPHCL